MKHCLIVPVMATRVTCPIVTALYLIYQENRLWCIEIYISMYHNLTCMSSFPNVLSVLPVGMNNAWLDTGKSH